MIIERYHKTQDEVDVSSQTQCWRSGARFRLLRPDDWQSVAMNLLSDRTRKLKRHLPVESEFHFRYLASSAGGINDEAADASYALNDQGTENCVVRTMRPEFR